jgi:hypothetical protein
MLRRWVIASAAALVGLVGAVSSSQAVVKPLLGVDANGNTFSSGWTYEVPDASAGQVNLVFIRTGANGAFFFEKDAVISNNDSAVVISFAPVAGQTQAPLVIADEAVHNNSGTDWTGFRMVLSSSTSASFGFGTTDGSDIGAAGGFRIDPFTTATFANGTSDLTLGGGTVAAGTTWFPGAQSSVGLTLNVSGNTAFDLKEIPIASGTGPGPVPIPLPAGVWTGLSGLVGLGLLSAAKSAKKQLA